MLVLTRPQFEAVSVALWGTPMYHPLLRQLAVALMRAHPEEYVVFLGADFEPYLRYTRYKETPAFCICIPVRMHAARFAECFGLHSCMPVHAACWHGLRARAFCSAAWAGVLAAGWHGRLARRDLKRVL